MKCRVPTGHGKSWKSSGHGKVMEFKWSWKSHGILKISIFYALFVAFFVAIYYNISIWWIH